MNDESPPSAALSSRKIRFHILNWSDGDVHPDADDQSANDDEDMSTTNDERLRYVVTAWGFTADGRLVRAEITERPFFYLRQQDADDVTDAQLERACRRMVGAFDGFHALTRVRGKPFTGYQRHEEWFLRLSFHSQKAMRFVSKALRTSGLRIPGRDTSLGPIVLYETQVPPMLRPMHRLGLCSTGWCEVDERGAEAGVPAAAIDDTPDLVFRGSSPKPYETEEMAPVVIATFDIEVYSHTSTKEDPVFPSAERAEDAIIGIVTFYSTLTCPDEPFFVHVLALQAPHVTDAACPRAFREGKACRVDVCRTERELLDLWAKEIGLRRALLWVHFNGLGFDEEYMHTRAVLVGARGFLRHLGWVGERDQDVPLHRSTMESAAYGCNQFAHIRVEGVFHLDLMVAIKRDYNLQSYSLDFCGEHFCGERKVDLKPQQQFDLYRSGHLTEILEYCVQDVRLTLRLATKLSMVTALVEMAGQTSVPLDYLITRGQQIKMVSSLVRFAGPQGYFLREPPARPTTTTTTPDGSDVVVVEKYQGATVLEPVRGCYFSVVACLDFASLYPSIMRAHNLSHETWVRDETRIGWAPEDVEGRFQRLSNGHLFLREPKGVLCRLLEQWADDRKRNKRWMMQYEKLAYESSDPAEAAKFRFLEKVYDARQKANKICMNSLYGFCGVAYGMQPCAEIAATVTHVGRDMIAHTKACCERMLPGSKVVYGDTDSVFWNLWPGRDDDRDGTTVREAFAYCERAAETLSAEFPAPNKLEFEKVFCPLLLFGKKRYSGQLYSADLGPDRPKKIDNKGLQLVRRDSVPFLKTLMADVLNSIHHERSYLKAASLARERIRRLFAHEVPLDELAASKKLNARYRVTVDKRKYEVHVGTATFKGLDDVKISGTVDMPAGKLWTLRGAGPSVGGGRGGGRDVVFPFPHAHVHVMRRIEERCPGSAPAIGDRVWYVYVARSPADGPATLQYEQAEDLHHAVDVRAKADVVYYYEHSVKNALESIFEIFTDKPASLFQDLLRVARNKRKGQREIGQFFSRSSAAVPRHHGE